MESAFNSKEWEPRIAQLWDEAEVAKPNPKPRKPEPFTILLPPPNANASLHAGHAMFVIEDILIRWKRLMGHAALWIPGTDHAGFETQFVYEKHLAKEGKSRFQFDRESLHQQIAQFVKDNSGLIEQQLRQLGFSLDWSRKTFTLDEHVIKIVYETFAQMVKDGLIYRDNYIVNYSPKSGTSFSELEVKYVERIDPLYYIKYGPFTIATVRPETKFRDVALAANPNDPRYKDWIGKSITFDGLLGPVEMNIIGDEEIDMDFGTGIMKVTPAHDAHDFLLGRKHNLPISPLIDTFGRMDFSWFINQPNAEKVDPKYMERAQRYHGKKVAEARKLIVADMIAEGMIEKIDEKYTHNVATDYKTGGDIEPLVIPNWFVRMKPLAEKALQASQSGEVSFIPTRFSKEFETWLTNIRDWPISRQIVWGIRIPVWYSASKNPQLEITFLDAQQQRHITTVGEATKAGHTLNEIRKGLQQLRAPLGTDFEVSAGSPGEDFLPETDTFDTWFSSGQWPLATLHYPNGEDFQKYYPTQVLDTMWDILFFWVARMIMLGIYRTGKSPFSTVYLHSMVTDEKGQKMSKSKGNVINPIDLVNEFGADALRMALIAGCAPGNPIALSREKVKGYRNFANKIWNIARYCVTTAEKVDLSINSEVSAEQDKKLLSDTSKLIEKVQSSLEKYRFSDAALETYDFIWNTLANEYLEESKKREDQASALKALSASFKICLQLLHPVMPFVTEAVWQELHHSNLKEIFKEPILALSEWPEGIL